MDQTEFCECIFRRERLSDRLFQLSSVLKKWDSLSQSEDLIQAVQRKHQREASPRVTQPWHRHAHVDIQTTPPRCYVCQNEFITCSHMCQSCQQRLSSMTPPVPCPSCNQWNHRSPTVCVCVCVCVCVVAKQRPNTAIC
jgi:hypothetical protein